MVSSVGIAATAFLLTLQPALAFIAPGTSNAKIIFARQFGNFNNSNVTNLCPGSNCSVFQTIFSNSPCFGLECLCTASVVSGLKTCIQCAVSIGAVPQSDITNTLNQFIDGCAEDGFPISGLSSSGGLSGGNSTSLSGTVTVTRLGATGLSATGPGTAGPGTSVRPSAASLGATSLGNTSPANTVTTSTGTTVTLSAAQETSITTPVAPVNTSTTVPLSAASKMSISTFGIMITSTVLGAIALL